MRRNGGHIRAPRARDHDDVGSPSANRLKPAGQQGKRSRGRPSWYGRSSSSPCSCGCLRRSSSMPTVRVASLGGRGVAARDDVPHALIHSLLGVTRHAARRMLGAGVLLAFHDGNHRWLIALSLAWKAPPGGRGEARRNFPQRRRDRRAARRCGRPLPHGRRPLAVQRPCASPRRPDSSGVTSILSPAICACATCSAARQARAPQAISRRHCAGRATWRSRPSSNHASRRASAAGARRSAGRGPAPVEQAEPWRGRLRSTR